MRYRFGNCELSIDSHELLVGGTPKTVEPQVFDLLRHMVENAGRLVSHDDLIEAVWGGRIVSDSAISARISAARAAIGDDGARQAMIKTVPRRGFRFIAEVEIIEPASGTTEEADSPAGPTERQRVRFCTSRDGTRIALANSGGGYPLVRAGHWLTHLEHDWHSPVWRPFLDELGGTFEVIRYDQRGNGLSDWSVEDFSLTTFVEDLEAVIDCASVEKFALFGSSQGVPIAIDYATRHPERISHLILLGGYHRGRLIRGSTAEREQGEALLTLIRHSWGTAGSPFLKMFASMYIPEGTREQIDSLAELQRRTASPENAARIRAAVDNFDVSHLLSEVAVPTLVVHSRNDGVHPLDQGRELAAGIGKSEFVMLESANHVLLAHELAWNVLFDEIRRFVLG